MLAGVEDRDLGGKVLGFQDDRRGEVGQWAIGRYLPLRFHRLGGFPEQCLISLAANQRKVIVAAGLLEDDFREFFLRGTQLFAGRNTFGL